jgi:hypothetical protein
VPTSTDNIQTAVNTFLSCVPSHELETALQIPTWSERNLSLGASELAVTRVIFLVHLVILSYLKTQMLLVI